MRIHSGKVATILSRTRKSQLNLATQFEIPPHLYDRINNLPTNASSQPQLLTELFRVSKGSKQKAIVGSLLLEHNVRLPMELDKLFLSALVDTGHTLSAWKLWKHRQLDHSEERTKWNLFGLEILCRSFKMVQAEQLVREKQMTFRSALTIPFIRAYAEMGQFDQLTEWLHRFEKLEFSRSELNAVVAILIKSKCWPQLQHLLSLHPNKVSSQATAECLLAIPDIDFPVLILMLSQDGNLVNFSKFQRILKRDVRYDISTLLSEGKTQQAIELVKDYNGPHKVFLCHQILKETRDIKDAELLYQLVVANNNRNSMFVQFMLLYYSRTKGDPWQFIQEYRLQTPNPNIKDHLTTKNYESLWKLINKQTYIPISLREMMYTTLNSCALTPLLLETMSKTLQSVPDYPAITSLYEYAAKICGLPIDWTAESLKMMPNEEFGLVLAESEPVRERLGL